MFWIPFLLLLLFVTVQATSAQHGIVRFSLLAVTLHTVILFGFFTDHPLAYILYILTIQMWILFVVTVFRRNKWREGRFV
ncbi:hypothetical protein MKY84_13025 [Chryseomicrobium sp. FSL W7-1435]|uniref:hypothetical protein n=1 Tax=Chryseomicrobium sp. FSL W7-1435 TaxID=2921704 RepID=UPI00315AB351